MITTRNKIVEDSVSKELILKYLTEEDIFRKYISEKFVIGRAFLSPLEKENNPSFGIYDSGGRLFFKDFRGEHGDCFKYVMLKNPHLSFREVLIMIKNDFNLGKITSSNNSISFVKKEKFTITIEPQEFTEIDIEYWGNYGISVDTLRKFNVYSVRHLFFRNRLVRVYDDKYPIYAYYFPLTGNKKIYIPTEDKANKWVNTASNELDIQGYQQLPTTGDVLYITKSMKDTMCLYEQGISSISTHGENHYISKKLIEELKQRFKKVIIFFDNDDDGLRFADKMSKIHELEYIYIPDFNYKDISDYYKGNKQECKIWIQQYLQPSC